MTNPKINCDICGKVMVEKVKMEKDLLDAETERTGSDFVSSTSSTNISITREMFLEYGKQNKEIKIVTYICSDSKCKGIKQIKI